MGKNTGVLAIDFGGSSGRVMYGTYDGKRINLQEVHRFSNDPVIVGRVFHCTNHLAALCREETVVRKGAGNTMSAMTAENAQV